MEGLKRVSELIPPGVFPEAEQIESEEIVGKDIVIEDYEVLTGKFGEFAVICFKYMNDEKFYSFACGGKVVMKKLAKLRPDFPVIGNFFKPEGKRYYDLK
jgi:hypothetical protein